MSRRLRKQRRGPLVLEEVREKDPEGRIVVHHRVADTLARMRQGGTIDAAMLDAGREFQRSLLPAQLDPLRAVDLLRVPGCGREPEPGHVPLAARDRVHRALLVLGGHGSPAGSCAWYVLGCGRFVREWALRQGWGGRPVRQEQGMLAAHYGLCGPRGDRSLGARAQYWNGA